VVDGNRERRRIRDHTGESAPVIAESGATGAPSLAAPRVLSDRIVVQITQKPGESFIDRMIALVEARLGRRTPNEIALTILLAVADHHLSAPSRPQPLAIFSKAQQRGRLDRPRSPATASPESCWYHCWFA